MQKPQSSQGAFENLKPVTLPFEEGVLETLKAGDLIGLTGVLFTGRDQTHRRLVALLDEGKELPVDLKGQLLYYVGPSPARPGQVIGAAGPTTSYRMDPYTPRLLELGLKGTLKAPGVGLEGFPWEGFPVHGCAAGHEEARSRLSGHSWGCGCPPVQIYCKK